MKSMVKAIIAGSCVIVLGVVILLIALGLNGWTFKADFTTNEFVAEQDNNELIVENSIGSVKINYYDGEKVQIIYPESENYKMSISEQNGYVKVTTPNPKWYEFSIWRTDIPEMVINLPKTTVFQMHLKVNAGSLRLEGKYSSVWLTVNAGSLRVTDVECDKIYATVNAGSMFINNLICDTLFKGEVNAGSMLIDSIICTEEFNAKVNAGSLNAKYVACPYTNVSVSTGSLNITLKGNKSDYSISAHVTAGSSNISNQKGTTDKKITANVSAGSLKVNFTLLN